MAEHGRQTRTLEELLLYLERFPDGEIATLAPSGSPSCRLPDQRTHRADNAVELAFWDLIKDSKDPAEFDAYLDKYPEGNFVSLAKARLERLADEAAPRDEARG